MRRRRKLLFYVFLLLAGCWSLYQINSLIMGSHTEKQNAGKLLYQVSLFQMELLGSFLHDANQSQGTEGLDMLRQAIYTANFTHEHLVLAFGEDELVPLKGLTQLMQYVVRLQIGGQRPLKADESQTLEQVRKQYADLYDAYGKLMSTDHKIVSSQNERLIKTDKAMTELIKKKLLQ
ncbi:S-adenosylmethionine decarboxylase [Paenibacillus radicis (ex Xue et al. 2023)]|uniref:S-adenosylmethionine decarboxylase n=1 Tax=Paenibacillus radicis (ex Xue et al. 2023) TaxID=2972489 RepID=A0ABT1Y8U6_9BACL|nr:S-adenosylmethionine decarboxylase [Paenibacillus radicis (ex Xue et al. 2023)]MCR8629620.1 S-adenosylmethionine decarboxylase [Paenibacillus radicis (ex Xue et al. 2023)]